MRPHWFQILICANVLKEEVATLRIGRLTRTSARNAEARVHTNFIIEPSETAFNG